jgi:hypothetical protein
MKVNFKIFLALVPALVLFCGCPVGTQFSLADPGTEKIDDKLIGTWTNHTPEHELVKVKITKKDNYTYDIEVLERGQMYALETNNLIGWVTKVGDRTFLYAREPEGTDYYHYGYEIIGENTMTSYGVSLKGKGLDEIKTNEEYRKEMTESMEKDDAISEYSEWTKE